MMNPRPEMSASSPERSPGMLVARLCTIFGRPTVQPGQRCSTSQSSRQRFRLDDVAEARASHLLGDSAHAAGRQRALREAALAPSAGMEPEPEPAGSPAPEAPAPAPPPVDPEVARREKVLGDYRKVLLQHKETEAKVKQSTRAGPRTTPWTALDWGRKRSPRPRPCARSARRDQDAQKGL